MITPAFGLTATERVLPKLALDFTTASLDSRITFTRATSASNPATYVNSSGYVTAATNNQPRFDYDPVALTCKGLLVEESRSNQIIYSEDFTQSATWVPVGAGTTANSTTSPDGTVNAVKLTETAVTSAHRVYQLSPTLTGTFTYTVYAKQAERKYLVLAESRVTGNRACFDLDAGTIVATAVSPSATITNAGNGWWRCSIQSTVSATYFSFSIGLSNTATAASNPAPSYAGTEGYGIYIWGAQLEAGAFATSYIPTTTTALTRNADVATITGTNFSDWWQASKGGAQVQALPSTVSGIRPLVQYDDGTANNIISLRGNAANPELQIVDGGAPQVQLDAGTIVANTPYSLTGWWQTNDCKARQNSGATVSDYTATIPTVTQARLGSDGTNYLNGHLANISYYDTFSGQIYTRRKNKAVFSLL